MSVIEDHDPWHLTIILLEGLRLMRPEKVWRPIVTVEMDNHHLYETTLGVDGQCVNQKDAFTFYDVTHSSHVDLKIWHRSQSKKKKRKILVGSASHTLGELLRKQENESKLEIRLQCRTDRTCVASRGRPQKGAMLRVRLTAPPTFERTRVPRCWEKVVDEPEAFPRHWEGNCSSSEDTNTDDSASVNIDDILLDNQPPPQVQPQQTIRRRIKGYVINSDDDMCSSEGEYTSAPDTRSRKAQSDNNSNTCVDEDEDPNSLVFRPVGSGNIIHLSRDEDGGWTSFSDLPLPLYTEKITVFPRLTRMERILASMTTYGELTAAQSEDDFEPIFRRLQQEWTFVGGLLVALAAVDTAVFSISPDSIFNVGSYARGAIATSSVASGLGIACDAWFLLRYNWSDLRTFITRSRDVYNTYLFFSISARTPAFCMFLSSLSLMLFLAIVAFDAWPQGVLALSFIVGIVMSMQFLVYGAHWCANRVADGGRAGGRGVVRAVRVVRSMTG